jgi:hypothetical protein
MFMDSAGAEGPGDSAIIDAVATSRFSGGLASVAKEPRRVGGMMGLMKKDEEDGFWRSAEQRI